MLPLQRHAIHPELERHRELFVDAASFFRGSLWFWALNTHKEDNRKVQHNVLYMLIYYQAIKTKIFHRFYRLVYRSVGRLLVGIVRLTGKPPADFSPHAFIFAQLVGKLILLSDSLSFSLPPVIHFQLGVYFHSLVNGVCLSTAPESLTPTHR